MKHSRLQVLPQPTVNNRRAASSSRENMENLSAGVMSWTVTAGTNKNYRSGLRETSLEDESRPRTDPVYFWCWPGKMDGSRSLWFVNIFANFSRKIIRHMWAADTCEWVKADCWALAEVYILFSEINVSLIAVTMNSVLHGSSWTFEYVNHHVSKHLHF